MVMSEDLIEQERIRAIQEQLMGFLMDEVVNKKGEFWADHRVSIGQLDPNRGDDDVEEDHLPKKKKHNK